jgi:hypothetical protein
MTEETKKEAPSQEEQLSDEQLKEVAGGVDLTQLRRENLDRNAADLDELRRENLDRG